MEQPTSSPHVIPVPPLPPVSSLGTAPQPPATFSGKLLRHLRHGTLADRVLERMGVLPEHAKVRWRGAEDEDSAARALARWAQLFLKDQLRGAWVLSIGNDEPFHRRLNRALTIAGVPFRAARVQEIRAWDANDARGIAGVVCGHADAAALTVAARALAAHPLLASVRFEYAAGINVERAQFRKHDEYRDTYFVGPQLLDETSPYAIYEESLKTFEQKCGLRDYLDLYQALKHVVRNDVPGDIAEFGSYRGHSGWLMAHSLAALGCSKRVFLFDMFEEFPDEPLGVDHIWKHSHQASFDVVRQRFANLPNVTLVKGDFTQSIETAGLGPLALVHIDCDSYRGTRFLIDRLWDTQLSKRGVLVSEDYGHPALLAARAAVHESLDARPDCFRFFSQFSGLYVAAKM